MFSEESTLKIQIQMNFYNFYSNHQMSTPFLKQEQNDGLDSFTDNYIGQGRAQTIISMPLYLMLFSEGCQSAVLGILLPKLNLQWQINDYDKSMLITFVFVGVVIGSGINSFADKVGRYKMISCMALIVSIFGTLSCVCMTFNQFLFVRFVYGIGMGITLPMSGTFLAEISTTQYRSTLVSLFCVLWAFGAAFASVLGWILLKGFHWRILFFLITLPSILALYIHYKYGRESLRFLISMKKYEEAYEYVNFMRKMNNKDGNIQMRQIKAIKMHEQPDASLLQLLSPKHRSITLTLCCVWVAMAFIYYSIALLLPSILQPIAESEDQKYFIICCAAFVQVFSYPFAIFLMERPDLGRKNSLILIISIVCAMSLFSGFVKSLLPLIIVFGTMKLCSQAFAMVLFTYTSECYPTALRAQAMSAVSMSGRIATVIMGIIGIAALHWLNGYGLYLIFFCLSGSSIFLIIKADKETLGKPMDY